MLSDFLRDLAAALDRRRARMVPVLGAASGRATAPARTAAHYRWPFPTGEVLLMFQMTDSQQVRLGVEFKDKRGNPARVEGVPEWLVDNPNVLALQPAGDGLSCVAAAVGPLGTARVTLKADADLGAGVTELLGTFEAEVVGGEATTVAITAGTPEERPA